jgi:hypothetical protein
MAITMTCWMTDACAAETLKAHAKQSAIPFRDNLVMLPLLRPGHRRHDDSPLAVEDAL